MSILIIGLLATLVVSLVSLLGIILIKINQQRLQRGLLWMISFSAGGMLGGAFFHLLPEAVAERPGSLWPYGFTLLGFSLFFILERILRVHHCHEQHCDSRRHIGILNLIGDGIHNFIDGLIIMSAFMVNIHLGIVVTISVALHEIPQEIGDYGVLLYAGYSRLRALFFNFLSALLAIAGAAAAYVFINLMHNLTWSLIPLAAGGFIYIAAADLIPELHTELKWRRSAISFLIFVVAVLFMLWMKIYGSEV